jgi:diguanylate cyclase (GGDEF)-like protein
MIAGIRLKIVLPVLLIGLAGIVAVLVIGAASVKQRTQIGQTQAHHLELVGHSSAARSQKYMVSRLVAQAILERDTQDRAALAQDLANAYQSMQVAITNFEDLSRNISSARFPPTINETIEDWYASAEALVLQPAATGSWHMTEFIERDAQLRHYFDQFFDHSHQMASDAVLRDNAAMDRTQRQIITYLVAGLLCTVLLAAILSNRVALAVARFAKAMRRLADGDLDVPISGDARKDEIGDLARSLKVFRAALNDVVASKLTMEQMALTDVLTSLPNRRGLFEFFRTISANAGNQGRRLGLMHVDLDYFKTVNDTLGHDAGDFVLREAALRMKSTLRESDVVARIGGDEFVALVPRADDELSLETISQRIVAEFDRPIIYKDTPCHIGATVGATQETFNPGQTDLELMLQKADTALCTAKANGRGTYLLFREEMGVRRDDEANLARRIMLGLRDEEFEPWFQPMIDARTGAVTGLELLSRWRHPELGLLLPEDFLQAAVAHNAIGSLGMQVLEIALDQMRSWRLNGLDVPVLHVNVSRTQILAPSVVDAFSWALDNSGFAPDRMSIEISETDCVGRGEEAVASNLHRLRDLGCGIVLDEFGSDTGSINNLIRLGANKTKTARGLISKLVHGDEAQTTLKSLEAILSATRCLGLDVVAKGISNPQERAAIRQLGFDELQGDAISPAMDAERTKSWLLNPAWDAMSRAGTGST